MTSFRYSALLSLTLLATVASAQPAERSASQLSLPAPRHVSDDLVPSMALDAFPASRTEGAPASKSMLVGCTSGQNVQQTTANTGFTITTAGAAGRVGQSFTAPCDGFLTDFAVAQAVSAAGAGSNNGTNTTVDYFVVSGEGPSGPTLDSNRATFANGTTAGIFFKFLAFYRPVPVTQGTVYTLFVQYVSGGPFRPRFSSTDLFAGGQFYDGGTANPTRDLTFAAFFEPATTATTPVVARGRGYRLLSAPFIQTTVKDIAALNLVQGIAGDGTTTDGPDNYPAQYAQAQPNLYTAYNGNGTYTKPGATFDFLTSGRGFFWEFYDQAISVAEANGAGLGSGTSFSRSLAGYQLSLTGVAQTANVAAPFARSADGFYMLGNPFALPLAVTGISKTAGDGALVTSVQAYNPATSSYQVLFANNPGTGTSDFIAVWNGVFAEVQTGTTNPTFTYAIASTSAAATPTFYGRTGAQAHVQLRLDGTTASGTPVADEAAHVRFLPEARTGRDTDDAGKLMPPPGVPYALIAPVGERDGAPARLAVDALPLDLTGAVTVPVAFAASDAGEFTLTWPGASELPDEWTASLRDTETGAVVDLRSAESYTFASGATDWAERFSLVVASRGAVATEAGAPAEFALAAPSPNPTSSSAVVSFDVPEASDVSVAVYDLLGRRVAVLAEGAVAAGRHTARLDAGALAPGVYVVRMAAGTFAATQRVTIVR